MPHRRPPVGPSARRRRLRIETLEHRRVLSGLPLGAEPLDTAEYMLGTVAVTPVFFESTGAASTQDWTAEEIDGVLQKIRNAMDWWSDTLDTLDTVHTLEFVYDETFAREPFETSYEPIEEISNRHESYLASFLQAQQADTSLTLRNAVRAFNNQQREALGADWAVTILVVDASGTDGTFKQGGSFSTAFAYAGGAYMVVPSTRDTNVFTHELGHLFWAQDEYTGGDSWSEHRGYYDTLNLNAANNPDPDFVQDISIMAGGTYRSTAFQNHYSPASTLALVGWQDSDGDGIFDVLDVPLELQGVASYDADSQQLEFSGSARAVALPNQNPEGLGNDITLNRISRIEYRVDGGVWRTAVAPDLQVTDVEFSLPLSSGFERVDIRAIDASSGVTSPVISATPTVPGSAPAAVNGYAFLDENADEMPALDEAAIDGLVATVVAASGGGLPAVGQLDADAYSAGSVLDDVPGLTPTANALYSDGQVAVTVDSGDGAGQRLAWYKATTAEWIDRWSPYDSLDVRMDEPTTRVQVTIAGAEPDAVGRLEAYDALGNLLDRDTSVKLQTGQSVVLEVQDPSNQIARIRVLGHAASEILVTQIGYGPELTVTSGEGGVFRFENLPDGTYDVAVTPPSVIHEFAGTSSVTVAGGRSSGLNVAVQRIASPWQNALENEDVDGNQELEPLDALLVINYLNRYGSSPLPSLTDDDYLIDADGDGWATPTDALLVVNALNRRARTEGQGSGELGSGELGSGELDSGGQAEQAAGWNLRQTGQQTATESGTTSPDAEVLAVDRLMAGNFSEDFLSAMGGATAPESPERSDYNDNEPPSAEKPADPLEPFFSEPLRSEGF